MFRDWSKVQQKHKEAVAHGLRTVPVARQFVELYPDADSFYTYYTGTAGSPILNCQTALFGRYELNLQASVEFDKSRTKVLRYGEPQLHLVEIESIARQADGRDYIKYGRLQKRLDAKDWEKLYAARGDFAILGIELIKDKAVPNFDAYWKKKVEGSG